MTTTAPRTAQSEPSVGTARPRLSIVTVSYNSEDTILDCLRSIPDGGLEDVEAIVVDNASADRTVPRVRAFAKRAPWVRLVEAGTNSGFSGGSNLGIGLARAPYILLLNPDTVVQSGALRALVEYADRHPRAGMVGCRILYPDERLQHSCFRFPTLRMAFFGFFPLVPIDDPRNGRHREEEYEHAHRTEHLLGAVLLVRREVVEQIGLLDAATFPMYFEETDWCHRASRAGWELHYTPAATVVHHQAHSTAREPERMSVAFHRSQARYYRRYHGLGGYLALKAIVVPGLAFWLARTTRGLLRGRVDRGLWWRRAVSYWAILWA